MAKITSNIITSGLRGKLGEDLVFKTIRGTTFVSTPARPAAHRTESGAQRNTRITFRQASEWAQHILLDAEQKAYYRQRAKVLKLPNAYTAALTDYMRKATVSSTRNGNTVTHKIAKPGFTLQQVSIDMGEETNTPLDNVAIRQRRDVWLVEYRLADNLNYSFTLCVVDRCNKTTLFKIATVD